MSYRKSAELGGGMRREAFRATSPSMAVTGSHAKQFRRPAYRAHARSQSLSYRGYFAGRYLLYSGATQHPDTNGIALYDGLRFGESSTFIWSFDKAPQCFSDIFDAFSQTRIPQRCAGHP